LLRPPSPGCQPKGFNKIKSFNYKKEYKGVHCWGWVEYEDKLNNPDKWDLETILPTCTITNF
jgi:hypothetical protein